MEAVVRQSLTYYDVQMDCGKHIHLFGVEFLLKRDTSSRYCEVIAKSPDEITEVLENIYEDFESIVEIDDNGECDENGELIVASDMDFV